MARWLAGLEEDSLGERFNKCIMCLSEKYCFYFLFLGCL